MPYNNFDDFKTYILTRSREIVSGFTQEDDDLDPTCILVNAEGKLAKVDIRHALSSDLSKTVTFRVLVPAVIRDFDAVLCATVITSWMSFPNPDALPGTEKFVPPSQDPKRKEVLLVNIFGTARVDSHFAEITRHAGAPPTLGDWQGGEDFSILGRLVDGLRDALMENFNAKTRGLAETRSNISDVDQQLNEVLKNIPDIDKL